MISKVKKLLTILIEKVTAYRSNRFSEDREKRLLASIDGYRGGILLIMSAFGQNTGSH